MKIYTKIILDKNNQVLEEEFFEYLGPMALAGIHYTYGANKNAKLMEKQAKKERRLAEKRAKKQKKDGPKKEEDKKPVLDPNKALSLDFITNPNKE